MKWKINNTRKVRCNTVRMVSKFAFFPVACDDGWIIWLKRYWIIEVWPYVVFPHKPISLFSYFLENVFHFKWIIIKVFSEKSIAESYYRIEKEKREQVIKQLMK